jgi:hypothetical protein
MLEPTLLDADLPADRLKNRATGKQNGAKCPVGGKLFRETGPACQIYPISLEQGLLDANLNPDIWPFRSRFFWPYNSFIARNMTMTMRNA